MNVPHSTQTRQPEAAKVSPVGWSLAAWQRAVRDAEPPRRSRHFAILAALSLRLSGRQGFASVRQIAADSGSGQSTVLAALRWAIERQLVVQVSRGHRLGNGQTVASRWVLLMPATTTPPESQPLSSGAAVKNVKNLDPLPPQIEPPSSSAEDWDGELSDDEAEDNEVGLCATHLAADLGVWDRLRPGNLRSIGAAIRQVPRADRLLVAAIAGARPAPRRGVRTPVAFIKARIREARATIASEARRGLTRGGLIGGGPPASYEEWGTVSGSVSWD